MNIKEFFRKYWPYLTFFIISFVLAIIWTKNGNIYGTDDIFSLFRDKNFLSKGFYFWEDQKSFGSFNVGFPRIIFFLTEYFINNNFISHISHYFLNLFLAMTFCYLLTKYLSIKLNFESNNFIYFMISFFYVFSPFNYYYTFQDQTGFQWLLAFIPLFLYFYFKIVFNEKLITNVIILGIISLYFGPAFSQILLFVLGIFTFILTIIFYKKIKNKKRILIAATLVILLWAWSLLPLIISVNQSLSSANKGGMADNLIYFASQYNTLIKTMSFTGYSPINFMPQQNGVLLNPEGFYYKSIFFTFLMIFFYLIMFTSLLKNKNKNVFIGLILIIIIFLLSNLSVGLISQIPIIKYGLRNSFNKFAIYYGLIFALFFVSSIYNLFYNYNKKLAISLIVIFFVLFSLPFFISSPIYRGGILNSYYVTIPHDYPDFYFKSDTNKATDQKILLMPLNLYGTTFFNWASPVESLILDQYTENQVSSISYTNEASKNITYSFWYDVLYENKTNFDNDLRKYNIYSVVFDNNINWTNYKRLNLQDPIYLSQEKYISTLDYLKKNHKYNTFGNITEIIIDKYPLILSHDIIFSKLNPTKYNLYISNLKEPQNLSFLESYHKEWKLYLKSNPSSSWCKPLEFYNNTQTTECQSSQKLFEGEELSYLYKKPIFDDTHQMVNDYANGWTIDSQYIKDNYSPEYYTTNPDGSINVELVMYFQPQSYFYLGLIISITTLILCIIYLIYDWRK